MRVICGDDGGDYSILLFSLESIHLFIVYFFCRHIGTCRLLIVVDTTRQIIGIPSVSVCTGREILADQDRGFLTEGIIHF